MHTQKTKKIGVQYNEKVNFGSSITYQVRPWQTSAPKRMPIRIATLLRYEGKAHPRERSAHRRTFGETVVDEQYEHKFLRATRRCIQEKNGVQQKNYIWTAIK